MKETIIQKAADMFITFGFKSVTMDDIANEMGISKKTIYTHFKNKTELVSEVTQLLFNKISCGIDHIRESDKNPIEELYEIKKFMMLQLKDEKSSPQYQLQKYYPQIAESVKEQQHEVMKDCTVENLKRGKEMGLYRENIDIGFVSRIYYVGVMGIKDDSLFPVENFPKAFLLSEYLEYHLRGIVTKEGLKTLNKIINQQST
ncbi:TetR/AcrR family transcriptional regulator [Constantimarinum furrinae]|uniref:TetR family transcriptional regulator n=1 Tax=Constantimarinum furrinae TaxID=2562285 RepID=A0A7G8PTR5_9FLAO|nr:TetR/AcrR family transcriptional regulator [Constantimarinum furrinae]QNJ97731.1 TetR family transcriptional regulator [Constantimarinum furrinae]